MTIETYDQVRWESPLAQALEAYQGNAKAAEAGVVMREMPFARYINVRGDVQGPLNAEIKKLTGLALPDKPNTYHQNDKEDIQIAWLGPDEWMVIASREGLPGFEQQLREALPEEHMAITDVSHGYTAISIQGEHARDLLAKGTPVDVSPEGLPAGAFVQTLLGKSAVMIWAESVDTLGVIVRRSFAEYIWKWLVHSGKSFGINTD